jgi:ornithine decarboxylase
MPVGEYEDFGVPATILANFLRENGIVPEKCDLNSILFLLTPAERTWANCSNLSPS